jgi:hypothetical protein
MSVMFKEVPKDSPLNLFEAYEIVGMTHTGFIYKSQVTGQEFEITNNAGYVATNQTE